MSYFLDGHIHCLPTSDGAIFLDARKSRYYRIPLEQAASLASFVLNWPKRVATPSGVSPDVGSVAPSGLGKLIDAGILTTSDPGSWKLLASPPPVAAGLDYGSPASHQLRISARHVLLFCWSAVMMSAQIRFLSLETILAGMRRRGRRHAPQRGIAINQIRDLVFAHDRIRPWLYVSKDSCLRDSLVLFEFLRLNGVQATLVIGVKSAPFAAHCWVQSGTTSLNNQPDELDSYEPILAISTEV